MSAKTGNDNRIRYFCSSNEGLTLWGMIWASQIELIAYQFLTINTLGCKEPAWNLRVIFWNLIVNGELLKKYVIMRIIIDLVKSILNMYHFDHCACRCYDTIQTRAIEIRATRTKAAWTRVRTLYTTSVYQQIVITKIKIHSNYRRIKMLKYFFISKYSEFIDNFLPPPNQTELTKIQSDWNENQFKCSAPNYYWTEWSSATDLNTQSDGNDYETLQLHRHFNSR